MTRCFSVFVALFLLQWAIHGDDGASGQPQVNLRMSKSEIISGEPVYVLIDIVNPSKERSFGGVVIWNNSIFDAETFKLTLSNTSTGKKVERRVLRAHPVTYMVLMDDYVELKAGACLTATYPLHLQYPTLLPPGDYSVSISRMDLRLRGGEKYIHRPDQSKASFTVLPYDRERLAEVYNTLLREALADLEKPTDIFWNGQDFNLPPSVLLLLNAYGPDAVKAQMALVYDSHNGFRFDLPSKVHAWENIACNAGVEEVRSLVQITDNPKFNNPEYRNFWDDLGLIWALHELNEKGTEEIRELTKTVVSRFPEKMEIENVGLMLYH